MRFNNILEDVLGSSSKIKVFRFLVKTNGEFSGRDIARGCGASHQSSHQSLQALSRQHIIIMRKSGKVILYSLNMKNIFVKKILVPVFKYEMSMLEKTLKKILEKINKNVEAVILYGSFAAGSENPGSDIDLCVILRNENKQKIVSEYFDGINEDFTVSFGNIISPYIISRKKLLEKYKDRDPHVIDIIQKGKMIMGKSMSELLLNE